MTTLDSVPASRLRRLAPSLSDIFFAAMFVWLFVAGGNGLHGLLLDGDIGWHIRTGEYILDHRAVPKADLFTFTKPGASWFAWEWGSDVLFAVAHRTRGLPAVVLIAAIVIAAWPVLLLRQALWRGASVWAALLVTLLGVSAGSIHFLARPHIFTLLLTTISVWLIDADRKQPGPRVWLLVPLCVLWTNLHGGFVVLILLLGLTGVGLLRERSALGAPLRYGVLTAACALASLLNPYGIGLHTHIAAYLSSDWIRNVVLEFQAPNFRSENQSQFELLLIAGLMAAALLAWRGRFVHALWLVAFAHLALTSARHIPVFVAVAAPILAQVLTEVGSAFLERLPPVSAWRIVDQLGRDLLPAFRRTSVWSAVLVGALSLSAKSQIWPRDFPAVHFPTALINAHTGPISRGRVLTDDQWADYLEYRFYPRQRVFADGRSDFLGPEIGNEYLRTAQGDYRWRETLERYAVDTVLAPVSWPLATILKTDRAWRVMADDGAAILFIRREDSRFMRSPDSTDKYSVAENALKQIARTAESTTGAKAQAGAAR